MKIGINRFIMLNSLTGKSPFPTPNEHHHERSINVFSVFSTFCFIPRGQLIFFLNLTRIRILHYFISIMIIHVCCC